MVGGRKTTPFSNKLEGARAGGVAALAGNEDNQSSSEDREMLGEEECVGQSPNPEHPLNLLCSPAKRPSLPDTWRLLPDNSWCARDPGTSTFGQAWGAHDGNAQPITTSTQLHRQLMALRLQRRTGVVDPPGIVFLMAFFLYF